jgi:hypothetical protein
MILIGCNVGGNQNANEVRLADWEAKLGVEFPASAKALGLETMSGMDDAVRIKVEMSRTDYPAFLESTSIPQEEIDESRRFHLGPDNDWWDPSRPSSLPTGQVILENSSVLNVGADLSDSEKAVVYIFWHQT